MFKYAQGYQTVEKLRKKHPDKSTKELFKLSGVSQSSYYKGKRHAAAGKVERKVRKVKSITLRGPDADPTDKIFRREAEEDKAMVLLKGTPAQIRAVLQGGAL